METFIQLFIGFITSIIVSTPDPILVKLDCFLEEKQSPVPAVEVIQYDNWKMIIAVSAAESGYGKYMAGDFNAWGIKDFESGSFKYGRTRDFASWEESIRYTSNLLYQYDPQDGIPSPRDMVRSWKYVLPYEHWINNVQYAFNDLEREVLD